MRAQSVLIVSQLPPPFHGSTIMTSTLMAVLNSSEFAPVLVDRRFSADIEDVGRFSMRKIVRTFGLLARLVGAFVRHRPVAVIYFATTRRGSFLVDCVMCEVLRVSRRLSGRAVPVIHYVHTQGFQSLAGEGAIWSFLVKRLLSIGDRVVSLSPLLETDVATWVPAERRASIPNATAAPAGVSARRPDGSEPPLVLFLSNLLVEKGPLTFARVATRLLSDGVVARFVVAGGGASSELAHHLDQEIAKAPADTVRAIGAVSGSDKWALLADADILVFPSTYDAQPLTIVEALAVGTPTVAYGVGGIPDLIQDGQTGIVVPPGDEEALFRAVSGLLADPSAVQRYSRGAMEAHRVHYSPDAYAKAWKETLAELTLVRSGEVA